MAAETKLCLRENLQKGDELDIQCITTVDNKRNESGLEVDVITQRVAPVGPLMGGPQCRMSILRNANVACLCRLFMAISHVEFKK